MQSRAVARERQHEPSALSRAGEYLGIDEELNHRAGVAVVSRDRSADDPGLSAVCCAAVEARRVKQLEDHIRRVVDAAPPLTAEQRDKLALLLRGSGV
jgi:hypothetical protein